MEFQVKIMQAQGGKIFSLYCKMPEVVKYGRCEPENMETVLEALRKRDVDLSAASRVSSLNRYLTLQLDGEYYFAA
jgi:hypothetical protein